jgi:hypothetical protein
MTTKRLVGALAAAGILFLVGCGRGSGQRSHTFTSKDANLIVLRLSDLPRGFAVGDDSGCGDFGDPEGASGRLTAFLIDERPSGCSRELNFLWPAKGGVPPLVESAAIVFDDPGATEKAVDLRRDLLDLWLGVGTVEDEGGGSDIGDASVAYSTNGALVAGKPGQPGAGVIWRSGNFVGIVFEGGIAGDDGREIAVDLARKQQKRAERRTPVKPSETNDREVSLDNPARKLPVYWLGHRLDPPGKLPVLELERGLYPAGGPGSEVKIDYGAGHTPGVTLDIWSPGVWQRFRRSRLGSMVWSWPCTESKELRLPEGRAMIFAGYSVRPSAPCPSGPPDRYLAHVYIDGVVVAVNMPYCYRCVARTTGRDPYNSLAGMEAIAKGLRRR